MNQEIKPILIVDAFFHNSSCLAVFKNYLSFIKKLNFPIMLVTNSKFEPSLIDEVDYILYDKNNRLFKKDYSNIEDLFIWYKDHEKYFSVASKAFQKHGLSVLSNLHHSTNLALSLGYTHFFRIEYDCNIPNIDHVFNIIEETQKQNKKGYVYVNQNKYISFQLWYFELDYFTKLLPKINSEDDYIKAKKPFSNESNFIIVEEFILNLINHSPEKSDNVIVKKAHELFSEFPGASWNTLISPAESDIIREGFISSIHKVAYSIEGIDDQYCPIDNTKFAIISWNCSSESSNTSTIKLSRKNQPSQVITHTLSEVKNSVNFNVFDLEDEGIEVQINMNNNEPTFVTINKNNIHLLNNIITFKK